jgi:hypothetical protein
MLTLNSSIINADSDDTSQIFIFLYNHLDFHGALHLV